MTIDPERIVLLDRRRIYQHMHPSLVELRQHLDRLRPSSTAHEPQDDPRWDKVARLTMVLEQRMSALLPPQPPPSHGPQAG